jgi:hypothetical protein
LKQVSYFKFLEKFPDFIDIDDDVSVKLALLLALKKILYGKNDMITKLLPINFNCLNCLKITPDEIRSKELPICFQVKFRKKVIMTVLTLEKGNDRKIVYLRPWRYYGERETKNYMSKEEITNFKRDILIENMLK